MDATFKRRMWKVAAVHFLASILFCDAFLKVAVHSHNFLDAFDSRIETPSIQAWLEAWYHVWEWLPFRFNRFNR